MQDEDADQDTETDAQLPERRDRGQGAARLGHQDQSVGDQRDGSPGFFYPDQLTFGTGVSLSRLVAAAQALAGVESVTVTRLERLQLGPNGEIERGNLPIGPLEVARLDGDPDFPEHGRIRLDLRGGR